MNRDIRVLLSTFGPLHLIKASEFLLLKGIDVFVFQGWIPSWWNRWFLFIASRIVGRDLHKAFERRTPSCLVGRNHSFALAEFYLWACKLFKLQSPMRSSYYASLIYGWQTSRNIKEADIFHVRSGSGFSGAVERAKSCGMKVVVDHSIAHPAFMDRQLRNEYKKNGTLFNLGLDNPFWAGIVAECEKADILLVNSEFVKDTFVQNGYDSQKIEVVMLGVRDDFCSLKKNYSLDSGVIKILFTGGFGFRKGAEYMLLALKDLELYDIKYEMICVGDSREAIPLIEKYKPRNLTCINTVPQEELKLYFENSDVYLFPSLCEGCASSGMEAMAAGMPVVATRESGLPIQDEVDGLIIESKSKNSIVNALIRIRQDQVLRTRLGEAAARKIANNYTWDKYAERVKNVYETLIIR